MELEACSEILSPKNIRKKYDTQYQNISNVQEEIYRESIDNVVWVRVQHIKAIRMPCIHICNCQRASNKYFKI